MRIIFTLACIYLFAFSSKAQFSKGTNQLSGYLGFGTEKTKVEAPEDDQKVKYFNFAPAIGHFYRDNRLAGVQLFFGGSYDEGYPSYNNVGGTVFLRQYVKLGKSDFRLFAQEGAGVVFARSTGYLPQRTVRLKSTGVFANMFPGLSYAVTKRFLLDLTLPDLVNIRYQRAKPTEESAMEIGTRSSFNINTGLATGITSIGVGASWAF